MPRLLRTLLVSVALWLGVSAAVAQTYELRFTTTFAGADTLLIDVGIRRTGGVGFNLGPSNISFTLDSNCVDVTRTSIRTVGIYNGGPFYGSASVGSTGTQRINLTVAYTGGAGIVVPTTFERVALLAVPITSCNCTITPTLSPFNSVATAAAPGVSLPVPSVVAPAFSLAQPTIIGSPISPLSICAGGVTSTYTSSAPGFWRISSSVGSVIVTNPNNVSSITVQHGVPSGLPSNDIVSVAPTLTQVCEQSVTTVLNPAPSLNFALSAVGSQAVCVTSPNFQLQLSGSELGVTYTLVRDGVLTGISLAGTGGPLLFAVPNLPLQSSPGYDFTYRAVRAPCTVQQVPPGVEISVVNCNLTPVISGPNTITQCGNSTRSFTVTPQLGTSTLVWTVLNRSVPPVVTLTGTSFGTTVDVNLGVASATQTDTLIVTEIEAPATGRDSVFITVLRAANPGITGPTFLVNPGSVTGNFSVPVAQRNPTSTYVWTTIPQPPTVTITPLGVPAFAADISFVDNGFYDVVVTETTTSGCVRTATLRVQVSTCNANPGTAGPSTTVCIGQNAVVYVLNDLSAPGGVQWEQSPSISSPTWTPVVGGFGANSQVYFSPPLTAPTYFRLRAEGSPACVPSPNFSVPIFVNAVPPPVPGTVTPRDTGVCETGSVLLRVTGGGGAIVWQQSVNGLVWQTASGVGTDSTVFISTPLTNTAYFRALFYNGCDSIPSNVVRVDIFQTPVGTATALPANYSICAGDISIPLVGTVTSFGGSGFWTSDGAGAINGLNQYVSSLDDTLRTTPVTLSFVVTSGTCAPDVNNIPLQVDGPSRASFQPLTTTVVCAGSTTDTLRGTAIRGVGVWDDGGAPGTFFPSLNSPRAVYQTTAAQAGTVVSLTWTVTSGACAPDAITRSLSINSNVITGSFSAPASPICFGDTTAPLGATNAPGTTGLWSSTGAGVFFPNPGLGNARYIPSPADQGTTIQLIWTVTRPACNPLVISHPLEVRRKPRAVVLNPDLAVSCYTTPYPLSGIALDGSGEWTILRTDLGPAPSGTFLPNPNDPNASYSAGLSDTNRTFKLLWTVTAAGPGVCPPASDSLFLTVYGDPRGAFSTTIPTICAGSSTIPLGAFVVPGQFGVWRTPNGSGTFSDTLNPNAFYNSDLTDASQNITLVWRVISLGCGFQEYTRTVFVNSSTIIGDWPGAPAPLPATCFTSPVALTASVSLPSTGVWRVNPSTAGTFADSTSATTTFTPAGAARGTTATITWRISNPPCAERLLTRNLFMSDTARAEFPQPAGICFPLGSDTLRARILGDPLAVGTWSIQTGPFGYTGQGAFTSPNDPNARYLAAPADVDQTLRLRWTVSNGICPSNFVQRDVRVIGDASISIVGPPGDEICEGDTGVIRAIGGDFYVWSGPNMIGSTFDDTLRVSPAASAGYLLLTGAGPCIFSRTYILNVREGLPVSASQQIPSVVCEGLGTQLIVTGAITGTNITWSRADGLPFLPGEINDPTIPNPVVFPQDNRPYRVRAETFNGCEGESIVTINTIDNTPPIFAADTLQTCLYELGVDSTRIRPIYALPPVMGEQVLWFNISRSAFLLLGLPPTTTHPNFVAGGTTRDLTILIPPPGFHDYTLYYNDGACESFTSVVLDVVNAPDADFIADRTTVPFFNPVVNFTSTTVGATTYFWNFGDPDSPLNSDNIPNPTHRFSKSDRYSIVLQVTDALGCIDLEVKSGFITVLPERYTFPTAFTPNADSVNDYFRPLPIEGEPCMVSIEIYDKSGAQLYSYVPQSPQVFLATNPTLGWDGTFTDGRRLDPGTYSYKVVIITKINDECTGPKQTYTGNITLVR